MAMYSAQRTIFNTALNLAMLSGTRYVPKPKTTLTNMIVRHDNLEGSIPGTDGLLDGQYPSITHFCLGTGGKGTTPVLGLNAFPYSQHSALDTKPFDPVISKHNGKIVVFEATCKFSNELYKVNKNGDVMTIDLLNGEEFTEPEYHDKNNLIIANSSTYVLASLPVEITIPSIKDLLPLLDGKPITDICLLTSYRGANGNLNCVQAAFFIDMTLDLETELLNGQTSLTRIIEVGGQCPMLT